MTRKELALILRRLERLEKALKLASLVKDQLHKQIDMERNKQ